MTGNKSPAARQPTAGSPMTLRELKLELEGRPPAAWRLDDPQELARLKSTGYVLAESAHYKLKINFTVSGDIVSGLRYESSVYRKGIRVAKNQQSLGTFGPQSNTHEVTFPRHGWDEAPSGPQSRGTYTVKAAFIDDSGTTLAQLEYVFEIKSAWPAQ